MLVKIISRSMQPGKAGIISFATCLFCENGEKLVFKIWTYFDCYIFILINYCIMESLSENNPVVAE
ncbi:hypothetical protein T4C_13942 [Trichinella pseudospiralis]|uniref:Uncharacterized protein n=1 Tax=Trichinella pseudospiralis TaxID=6337 RepID=A0A0V1GNN5_TRIPS|nr:hypothetical protein T4C_13942 [Trichinella pseudospiralis]